MMRFALLSTLAVACSVGCSSMAPEAAASTDELASAETISGACSRYATSDHADLAVAICQGDETKATKLIDEGQMSVNAPDSNRQTPLDVAFHTSTVYWQSGIRPNMVKALLDRGANPNMRFSDGTTALALAALFGDLNTVELLTTYGADVNLATYSGNTPLKAAARCDFRLSGDAATAGIIKFLVSKGAKGVETLQVPNPCEYEPALCAEDTIATAAWGTGYCKESYLLVKSYQQKQ